MSAFLKKFKKIGPYLIVVALVLPIVWPILQPGFWVSDDGDWMVIRLAAFHQTLRSGQFPVRFLWNLNHGYGYPVTNFLYPLPFYLGEAIHLLGFGFVDAIKILFGASFVVGAIFMNLLAGPVAAVVYTYLPYHLFDVYKRGSLGEAVAFAFAPMVFYFVKKKNLFFSALALAALITSHNTLAFLFLPIIVLAGLRQPKFSAAVIGAGLVLSAWFWLPAIYDLQFTRAATISVSDFTQYFLTGQNLPSLLGLPAVFLLLGGLFQPFWLVIGLVSLFFSLPVSQILWQNLPLPQLVQFPWRFLSLATFALAFLASALVKRWPWLGVSFVLILIVVSFSSLRIERTFQLESFYTTNDATTTVKDEYLPRWVKTPPIIRPEVRQTVYFPGVKVLINRTEVEPEFDVNGVITTPGEVVLRETPLRLFADLLSLAGLLLLISLCRKK